MIRPLQKEFRNLMGHSMLHLAWPWWLGITPKLQKCLHSQQEIQFAKGSGQTFNFTNVHVTHFRNDGPPLNLGAPTAFQGKIENIFGD